MGQGTLEEVWDGSGDPRDGPGRVEGLTGRFMTGQGTIGKVRDWSRVSRGGPERVEGLSGRSGTGRWTLGRSRTGRVTLPKVRDGLGTP